MEASKWHSISFALHVKKWECSIYTCPQEELDNLNKLLTSRSYSIQQVLETVCSPTSNGSCSQYHVGDAYFSSPITEQEHPLIVYIQKIKIAIA
jgi:uncharacterized protein (UPF0179 family)